MKCRVLGKTGFNISEVSLGIWQLGSKWGDEFNEEIALETLEQHMSKESIVLIQQTYIKVD